MSRPDQIGPDTLDSELAVKAQAGDQSAFATLVSRYADQARRVARSVMGDPDDGDDAAQDAFLTALRRLSRYDASRPFGPWLMRVVVNASIDARRRRKVRTTEQISPATPGNAPNPAVEADRRHMLDTLGQALSTLPERQRAAVTLFDVEGYPHAEIAEILGVPEGTVRSDVFHGRRRLREAFKAVARLEGGNVMKRNSPFQHTPDEELGRVLGDVLAPGNHETFVARVVDHAFGEGRRRTAPWWEVLGRWSGPGVAVAALVLLAVLVSSSPTQPTGQTITLEDEFLDQEVEEPTAVFLESEAPAVEVILTSGSGN